MRCLTDSEVQVWLRDRIFDSTAPLQRLGPWKVPKDAGRKMALAQSLTANLKWDAEGLVWATDWGIWPSSENMLIFDRFRLGCGETRSLSQAPAHQFGSSEANEAAAVLALGLYFMWDITVIGARDRLLVHFDHHEQMGIVSYAAKTPAWLDEWLREFAG